MAFESVWDAVSDWVFSYTPLLVFSDRVHRILVDRSKWLVLVVYLVHFVTMQSFAVLSGKMFLTGNIVAGVLFYIGKGLLAIPTIRFFVMEKPRLVTFWPIRIGYSVVVFIKNSKPYQLIATRAKAIKRHAKSTMATAIAGVRRYFD